MSKPMLTYAVNIASLVVVGLLGYLLLRIVLGLINPQSLWEPAPIPQVATQSSQASAQNYDFSTNPFSRSAEVFQPTAQIGVDAPETTLQLTLTGLISGEEGQVNLKTPDGREESYSLGDEIMNSVTLEAVNPTFIVLNVNGEIQRLTFDEDEAGLIQSDDPQNEGGFLDGADDPILAAQDLLSQINLTPALENGQVIGLKVTPKTGNVPLVDYGLRSGDIVTAIGSVDLSQGMPDIAALQRNFQAEGGVEMFLIRDGREEIIRIGQ